MAGSAVGGGWFSAIVARIIGGSPSPSGQHPRHALLITNDRPDSLFSSRISYDFPALGSEVDDDVAVIVTDNAPANNGGHGVTMWGPGSFEAVFVPTNALGDYNGDCFVDITDFDVLVAGLCRVGDFIYDDSLRVFDWNDDDLLSIADVARFQSEFRGASTPIVDCVPQ